MDEEFLLAPVKMLKQQAAAQLRTCNDITQRFGLTLSEEQIQNLVERRFEALADTGRVEFGTGILKNLIEVFCDSPYLTKENYEEMLWELQDSFYYFKNESQDLFSDDELLTYMKESFDTVCEGSLDYLNSVSLEELCRIARGGYKDANGNLL